LSEGLDSLDHGRAAPETSGDLGVVDAVGQQPHHPPLDRAEVR
jgi:hypothetical protein